MGGLSHLQVFHYVDQLSAVGWRQAAPLVEDVLQLLPGQLIKMEFHKAVPECPGEDLNTGKRQAEQYWNVGTDSRTKKGPHEQTNTGGGDSFKHPTYSTDVGYL